MNFGKLQFKAGEHLFLDAVKIRLEQLVDGWWHFVDTGSGKLDKMLTSTLHELRGEGRIKAATAVSLIFGDDKESIYSALPPFDMFTPEQQTKVKSRRLFLEQLLSEYGDSPTGEYIQKAIDAKWLPEKGYTEAIPNVRKVRRWLKRYRESGSDIRSLLDLTHLRGNKASRIDAKVEDICMDVLQTFYLKLERPTLKYAHSLARDRVRKENELRNVMDMLPIPTITTLKSVLKRIAITDIYAARHGKNAARIKFRSSIGSAVVDRPFQRWEVDHTRLDQVIVCEITGIVLGRPWLTVVIDRFTRAVMGYHLTMAAPSSSTLGAILKHCIRPKLDLRTLYPDIKNDWPMHGYPEMMVCDNGMEFHSKSFKEACLSLAIVLMFMPRKRPEMKGAIERFIGTLNRGIGNVAPGGRTFHSIDEKGDYDPVGTAMLTLKDMHFIITKWIVDVYHQTEHSALGTTPQWMWNSYVNPEDILYLEDDHVIDAIVGEFTTRKAQHYGIELNHILYNSKELAHQRVLGLKEAKIRWNTDDLGQITVILKDGAYIEVPATGSYAFAKGRSLIELTRARQDLINKGLNPNAHAAMDRAIAELIEYGINAGKKSKDTQKQYRRELKQEKKQAKNPKPVAVAQVEVLPVDTSLVIHQQNQSIPKFEIKLRGTSK